MAELLFYPFLILAGIIAYLSWSTRFKYLGGLLFLDFIFMSAYGSYFLDTGIEYETYRELAPFFACKMLLQMIFTLGYIHLGSKSLTAISIIIMGVLGLSTFISLYNIDVVYYEGIMLALSACQLIAGLGGAIGGYCNYVNGLRDRFTSRSSESLHK